MSGQTPVATSWSTSRRLSVATPWRSMSARLASTSAWVLETSGERLSVQLMKSARRPLKFQSLSHAATVAGGARSLHGAMR